MEIRGFGNFFKPISKTSESKTPEVKAEPSGSVMPQANRGKVSLGDFLQNLQEEISPASDQSSISAYF